MRKSAKYPNLTGEFLVGLIGTAVFKTVVGE